MDGSLAAMRGEPLGIIGTWGDTDDAAQRLHGVAAALAGWDGAVSVAVGALVAGETWAQAADGAFEERWSDATRTLATARAGKGPTFVQIAHEMNGDWMPWSVTSSTVDAFQAGWRRYAAILRAEFPAARIVFTANAGTASDIGIPAMWPGDDVVDVYGVDLYTGWVPLDSRADWDAHLMDTERGDSPRGNRRPPGVRGSARQTVGVPGVGITGRRPVRVGPPGLHHEHARVHGRPRRRARRRPRGPGDLRRVLQRRPRR